MRDILKKTVAVAMVAGAALALGACKSETTNTTTTIDNTASMTDMNGSMSDADTNTTSENTSNAM